MSRCAYSAPDGTLAGLSARDRPVHLARLPGAGVAYPAPTPEAACDRRGREPDRGLARLQGDRRRIRVDSRATSCSRLRSRSCVRRSSPPLAPRRRSASRSPCARDSVSRNITVMVAVPDDHRMSTELRIRVQELLVAALPRGVPWSITWRSPTARRHSSSSSCTCRPGAHRTCRSTELEQEVEGSPARGTTCSPTS